MARKREFSSGKLLLGNIEYLNTEENLYRKYLVVAVMIIISKDSFCKK